MDGLGDHWELWAMSAGGMKPHDVLRVATIFGAEAIGFGQDLGSVEPGKLADLIVLDANPLDDIHNTASIKYVMKNGRLYDGNTLDEVWPRKKTLEKQWWWDGAPGGVSRGELEGRETCCNRKGIASIQEAADSVMLRPSFSPGDWDLPRGRDRLPFISHCRTSFVSTRSARRQLPIPPLLAGPDWRNRGARSERERARGHRCHPGEESR